MKLKYTHPSATHFNLNKVYTLDELKKEISLDMIKILFSPVDGSEWTEEKPKKQKSNHIEFGNEEVL